MPNTAYQRGAEFERQVKAHLERAGWLVVKSAGSKGLCDLVGISKTGDVTFIECKTSKGRMSPKARLDLGALAFAYFSGAVLVTRPKPRQPWEWFTISQTGVLHPCDPLS
jgi:Holliday junction resolvase